MNIELFPCSGGMAEGFRRAGIVFDMAFDFSKDACDSYEKNLGHRPIQIDVRDLSRMAIAGWRPGPVKLLVADPPCTPWSRAGKRLGTADERDMLGPTFDLVALLEPDAFLIGNVPGLDDETNWTTITDHLGVFAKRGYCVRDFLRLDAADYGVPQHRVRPFWYGHRVGECLRVPSRSHCDPKELRTLALFGALRPWATCRDALGHLGGDDLGRPVRLRYRHSPGAGTKPRASMPDEPAQTVRAKAKCDLATRSLTITEGTERFRRPSKQDKPARTVTSADGTSGNRLLEWPWNRPSTTVTTRAGLPPPGHHPEAGSILSMPDAIVLSERAAAILQGFPESWVFCGKTKAERWQQIGMAMPPDLAAAVAREIVYALAKERAA